MPTTIPYDHPSLVLGGIVDINVMADLDQISGFQQKIDVAHDKLNSLLQMKHSLKMTVSELTDLNVVVTDLESEIKNLDKQLSAAGVNYAKVKLKNENSILGVRQKMISSKPNHGESPVDFSKSRVTPFELAYQSLKFDAQYFSFEENKQESMQKLESFVSNSVEPAGNTSTSDVTKKVSSQVQQQSQAHNLVATLVITATCTHRTVNMLEPMVLDPAKAVSQWNALNQGNKIDTTNPQALHESLKGTSNKASSTDKGLSLISGMAYGSSFIGMVHFVKNNKDGPQDLKDIEEQLKLSGWLQSVTGGFGVGQPTLNGVRNLLSNSQVSSHVSLVTLGVIPEMKSSTLSTSVKELGQPNQQMIDAVKKNTSSGGDENSVDVQLQEGSDRSQEGEQVMSIQKSQTNSLLQSLNEMEKTNSHILDVNSLMNAFDNYVAQINDTSNSNIGAPINCYIKKVSKNQIVKQWLNKIFSHSPSKTQEVSQHQSVDPNANNLN